MINNGIYLELVDEKHHKFYELNQADLTIRINYGRIGRPGKIKTLLFNSVEDSLKFFNRQFKQKQKRGYAEAIKGKNLPKIKGVHPGQLRIIFPYF
jgi:predicted DNA-binding WGR domain protein